MMQLFHETSAACSRITTQLYSTSFSSAIRLLKREMRQPVYNIYGFVRFADEIVDTFHEFEKETLLEEYRQETFKAIRQAVHLNPILHSFQSTVREFNIDLKLVEAFFQSMAADLNKLQYDDAQYREYIYGSAEVVGLMCLYIFCSGDEKQFEKLKPYAQALGAAFQKVNFLRDLKSDAILLNRVYFPRVQFSNFSVADKLEIERDIQQDFDKAYQGILQLPAGARFGVYVAYKYYLSLFKKIQKRKPAELLQKRLRISNYSKGFILFRAGMRHQLNML